MTSEVFAQIAYARLDKRVSLWFYKQAADEWR
jgi:hypothetical protein